MIDVCVRGGGGLDTHFERNDIRGASGPTVQQLNSGLVRTRVDCTPKTQTGGRHACPLRRSSTSALLAGSTNTHG
jgi:hypothetical protein